MHLMINFLMHLAFFLLFFFSIYLQNKINKPNSLDDIDIEKHESVNTLNAYCICLLKLEF